MMLKIFLFFGIFLVYLPLLRLSPHVAPDLQLISNKDLLSEFSMPYIWVSNGTFGLGENFNWGLTSWPLNFLYGFFGVTGLSFEVAFYILWVIPFFIFSYIGIKKLLGNYNINGFPVYLSLLVYLTNTYVLLLIDGGQLNLALAYSILPLSLALLCKSIDLPKLDNIFKSLVALLLISFTDFRVLYLLFFLVFVYLIFSIQKDYIFLKNLVLQGLFYIISIILIHFYWIWPFLQTNRSAFSFSSDSKYLQQLNLVDISNALLLQQPHWYENVFGRIGNLRIEFYLIPILVFSTFYFVKNNKELRYWLLVAVIGIFLAKGTNYPFGEFYSFLFNYLPGFSFFRDSSKFFFLVALAYSVLIGFLIKSLSKFKNYNFITATKLFLVIYFVAICWPVFLGKTTGMFSVYPYQNDFLLLNKYLDNQNSYSKIVWIPTKAALGHSAPENPALNALDLLKYRPFSVGALGRYDSLNYFREANYMGEILNVLGVSHIVYPPLDPRRDDMSVDRVRYHKVFLDQILEKQWVEGLVQDVPIPVIKTKSHQDLFFIPENNYLVVGSDDIYNQATQSASLRLSNNALVFLEEKQTPEELEFFGQKIILYKKDMLDLIMTNISNNELIFPHRLDDSVFYGTKWWKNNLDLIGWKEFLNQKYQINNSDFDLGGNWVIAEGESQISFKDKRFKNGSLVFARVLESKEGGVLEFSQKSGMIGKISTQKDESNLRWHQVGKLKEGSVLTVKSRGSINTINALAIIDEEEFEKISFAMNSFIDTEKVVNKIEPDSGALTASVSYKKVNPTKYVITITGIKDPRYLIFSQKYDSLWRLNGEKPISVYSILNGFKVDHDGEYYLEYEPQRYVYLGLYVSGATVLFLIGLYLLYRYKASAQV